MGGIDPFFCGDRWADCFGVFARRQRQAVTIANLVDAHQQIAEDALAALERSQDENAELQDRIAELQDENTALRKQAAKRIPDVVSSLQEAILSGGFSKESKPESPG